MPHTLHYRATRLGAWLVYWRTWRKRLWFIHCAVAATFGLLMMALMPSLRDLYGWAAACIVALVVIVAMSSLFPQIRFKGAERVLTVDESGWSTRVGSKSGARSWRDTLPIYEQPGAVVIPSNNNTALVIPNRAFATQAGRRQFIEDVVQWQSRAT
jgi:hypothetical protein